MRRCLTLGLALAALATTSVAMASTVSAASPARQQRVMIEQQHRFGAPTGTFVLYALTQGHLELDAGRYTYAAAERPSLVRNGQGIAAYVAAETLQAVARLKRI